MVDVDDLHGSRIAGIEADTAADRIELDRIFLDRKVLSGADDRVDLVRISPTDDLNIVRIQFDGRLALVAQQGQVDRELVVGVRFQSGDGLREHDLVVQLLGRSRSGDGIPRQDHLDERLGICTGRPFYRIGIEVFLRSDDFLETADGRTVRIEQIRRIVRLCIGCRIDGRRVGGTEYAVLNVVAQIEADVVATQQGLPVIRVCLCAEIDHGVDLKFDGDFCGQAGHVDCTRRRCVAGAGHNLLTGHHEILLMSFRVMVRRDDPCRVFTLFGIVIREGIIHGELFQAIQLSGSNRARRIEDREHVALLIVEEDIQIRNLFASHLPAGRQGQGVFSGIDRRVVVAIVKDRRSGCIRVEEIVYRCDGIFCLRPGCCTTGLESVVGQVDRQGFPARCRNLGSIQTGRDQGDRQK